MAKKSEHKKAWQTAQRALAKANDAEQLAKSAVGPSRRNRFKIAVAVVSTLSAIFGFLWSNRPHLDIELVNSHFDPARPFPHSLKISNTGPIDLSHVTPKMRICSAVSGDGGRIVGRKSQSCAGPGTGRGGIMRDVWANHKLLKGESWPLKVAADENFRFAFNATEADVSAYVEYWPNLLPGFLPIFSTERRFAIEVNRDGTKEWQPVPLD